MTKYLYIIHTGGSGRGLSFWIAYSQCAKRVALDAAVRRAEIVSGKAGMGTIYHAYQDIYHSNVFDYQFGMGDVEFAGPVVEAECMFDGYRVFDWYRDRYKPTTFGEVLATEQRFPQTDDQAQQISDMILHRVEKAKRPVHVTVDQPLFTVQYDLNARADDSHCKWWAESEHKIKVDPGDVVVDWKTVDAMRATTVPEYIYRMQFYAYAMVWEELFPDRPLTGFWASVITRAKYPKYEPIYTKPIGAREREVVWRFMADCYEQMLRTGFDKANPAHCFSWWRQCEHLSNGKCEQY